MIKIQVKFYNQEQRMRAYEILESRFILWPNSVIKTHSNFLNAKVQTDHELNVVLGFLNGFQSYIESCKWERDIITVEPSEEQKEYIQELEEKRRGTLLSKATGKEGR